MTRSDALPLVCLDIDGTITRGVEGAPIPGAAAAVRAVSRRHCVCFLTNATSRSHGHLARRLEKLGMLEDPRQLFTPASVARTVLTRRGHASGLLIGDPGAREDFQWFEQRDDGATVLLATEGHDWTIGALQPAFRKLLHGAPFYTLQRNRYFERRGALWTDLGPVAAFLEYAGERAAETLGKPSPLMFDLVGRSAGVTRAQMLMVGDDAEFDVAAAGSLGIPAVLVRTGKYRPGDESRIAPSPSAVLDSVADLPAYLDIT